MKTSDLKNNVKTRLQNQLRVLDEIRRREFVSNAELSRSFKVPAASTLRILSGLESLGCIRKSSTHKHNKSVGKPAIYFEISPKAGVIIAIDTGMLFTRFAIVDYSGNISEYKEFKTADILSDYAEAIAEEVKKLIKKSNISKENIIVVLGVSGSIAKGNLRTVFLPENYDLQGRLETLLDADIYMENDANLAAIAEKNDASIYDPTSILCILDKFELGTGIIINGRLYRGFNGVAGEFYRYNEDWRDEGLVGILSSENFKQLFPKISRLDEFEQLYRMLEDMAEKDQNAKKIMGDIADKLTFEFVWLIRMLDPEVFIFAGEISKSGKSFKDMLINNIKSQQQRNSNYFTMPKIIFSRLEDKSVLTGAGHFGINILSNKFLSENNEFVKNRQLIATSI